MMKMPLEEEESKTSNNKVVQSLFPSPHNSQSKSSRHKIAPSPNTWNAVLTSCNLFPCTPLHTPSWGMTYAWAWGRSSKSRQGIKRILLSTVLNSAKGKRNLFIVVDLTKLVFPHPPGPLIKQQLAPQLSQVANFLAWILYISRVYILWNNLVNVS